MKKILITALAILMLPSLALADTFRTKVSGYVNQSNCQHAINTLRKAGKGDTVFLEINTLGGYLEPYWQMKKALNGEKLVITVRSKAASAGAFMLMLSNNRKVTPGAWVMFHTGHANLPTGQVVKFSVYSPFPWVRAEAYRSLRIMQGYRWLFTAKEWETLRRGEDVTISAKRISTMNFKYTWAGTRIA